MESNQGVCSWNTGQIPSQSTSRPIMVSIHRKASGSSMLPRELIQKTEDTAREIQELKNKLLGSRREEQVQIGAQILQKVTNLREMLDSHGTLMNSLSPEQQRQLATAMDAALAAISEFKAMQSSLILPQESPLPLQLEDSSAGNPVQQEAIREEHGEPQLSASPEPQSQSQSLDLSPSPPASSEEGAARTATPGEGQEERLDEESLKRAHETDQYNDLSQTEDPVGTAEFWMGIYESGALSEDEINGLKEGLAVLVRKYPEETRLAELQQTLEKSGEETKTPKVKARPQQEGISQVFSRGRDAIARFLSRKKEPVHLAPANLLATLEDTQVPLTKRIDSAATLCSLAEAGALEPDQYLSLLTKMHELSKEAQAARNDPNAEENEALLQYGREALYNTPSSYLEAIVQPKTPEEHIEQETIQQIAEKFKNLIADDSRVTPREEQRAALSEQAKSLAEKLNKIGISVQITIPDVQKEPPPELKTLHNAVTRLTAPGKKLYLGATGQLESTDRSRLSERIFGSLGRVGRSKESQAAGDKLVDVLQNAVEHAASVQERINCLQDLAALEHNGWFRGYLSHASKDKQEAFKRAKTDLEEKLVESFTQILREPEGVEKQQHLADAQNALHKLQGQPGARELQNAYGKAVKAILDSPMEVSLRDRFKGVDSSQMRPVTFQGQQDPLTVQHLKGKALEGTERWMDDVRTRYSEGQMTQEQLNESVVFARNPALSREHQQYLIGSRPPRRVGNTLLPFGVKAGDEDLRKSGGFITEQEASLGSGVVGFAQVKLSSVLTPRNTLYGTDPYFIGAMHDADGNVQYIDAVVVSTAHLDFELENKADAHALALENEPIEGSPLMPEPLSEEARKDPEKVRQYDKQLKQYQVFLYTKSGRIPSKTTVKPEQKLSYEDATKAIEQLIRDGKSIDEIDKFLEGKFLVGPQGTLYPLEMIFRKYVQTTKAVFGGLEG